MNKFIRVIPKVDFKGPNVVKGIQFEGYRVLGLVEEFAELYYKEGADELIFQDAVASLYQRPFLLDVIKKVARRAFVPLTIAGGVRSTDDIKEILHAGADKVAINTAAVANPELLKQASRMFGAQCIVASLEVFKHSSGKYEIWVDYGRQPTGIDALQWAQKVVDLGVGEILLNSINKEGTGQGYDLDLVSKISSSVPVPVIACCGAGSKEDFVSVVKNGSADAVAASSVFHYHYAKPVKRRWMSFDEPRLRMGDEIDSGNVDFLNSGYGNFRSLQVTPFSVADAKQALLKAGVAVRTATSFEPRDETGVQL